MRARLDLGPWTTTPRSRTKTRTSATRRGRERRPAPARKSGSSPSAHSGTTASSPGLRPRPPGTYKCAARLTPRGALVVRSVLHSGALGERSVLHNLTHWFTPAPASKLDMEAEAMLEQDE